MQSLVKPAGACMPRASGSSSGQSWHSTYRKSSVTYLGDAAFTMRTRRFCCRRAAATRVVAAGLGGPVAVGTVVAARPALSWSLGGSSRTRCLGVRHLVRDPCAKRGGADRRGPGGHRCECGAARPASARGATSGFPGTAYEVIVADDAEPGRHGRHRAGPSPMMSACDCCRASSRSAAPARNAGVAVDDGLVLLLCQRSTIVPENSRRPRPATPRAGRQVPGNLSARLA